jgi:GNAT superfamily N-acetyltransferase
MALVEHAAPLQFGPEYLEEVRLRDGRRARIFTLRRAHAWRLSRGFEQLSSRSRYLRFLSFKPVLGAEQLRYLTETDGQRHFALGAAVQTDSGEFREAAVGRIVAIPDAPGWTEPAVTVLDAYQGQGLGSLLAVRLVAAARERGYLGLRAEVLRENGGVMRLIRRSGLSPTTRSFGPVLEVQASFEAA